MGQYNIFSVLVKVLVGCFFYFLPSFPGTSTFVKYRWYGEPTHHYLKLHFCLQKTNYKIKHFQLANNFVFIFINKLGTTAITVKSPIR